MEIFPAIDLIGGQAVRLVQGDYAQKTVYESDPMRAVERFCAQGARNLHVVDLDGAESGRLENERAVARICQAGGLFIEVGGGIRDEARIVKYLEMGVARVILGTVAITNFGFVEAMARKYPGRIAVGVDAREGYVAIQGWKQITGTPSVAFCRQLMEAGVDTVIYTDIAKDGGLSGTNLAVYQELSAMAGLKVVASGGISYEHEIEALRDMGVHAAIVGKALYAGALSLERVLSLAKGEETA